MRMRVEIAALEWRQQHENESGVISSNDESGDSSV